MFIIHYKKIAFGVNLLQLVECFYDHNNNNIFRGFAISYW